MKIKIFRPSALIVENYTIPVWRTPCMAKVCYVGKLRCCESETLSDLTLATRIA